MTDRYAATVHRNGEVRYWSVYQQVWVTEWADCIPHHELAAMDEATRERVLHAIQSPSAESLRRAEF